MCLQLQCQHAQQLYNVSYLKYKCTSLQLYNDTYDGYKMLYMCGDIQQILGRHSVNIRQLSVTILLESEKTHHDLSVAFLRFDLPVRRNLQKRFVRISSGFQISTLPFQSQSASPPPCPMAGWRQTAIFGRTILLEDSGTDQNFLEYSIFVHSTDASLGLF